MFHQPMSSPHKIRIFGLPDLAISVSSLWSSNSKNAHWARLLSSRLHQAQQHRKEGKYADQDQQDGNREDRRLQSLLGHPRKYGERSAPHVANRPQILPNRNDECE